MTEFSLNSTNFVTFTNILIPLNPSIVYLFPIMPSTVYLERELQKPAEAHSFKNIKAIRSYLVEQKADEIMKKWHHIK